MPIHEFICPKGHITERLFLTFGAASEVKQVLCNICGQAAQKVAFSVPYPAHFLGNPDGYDKPSPQKRHSTKLINRETGNRGTQRKG